MNTEHFSTKVVGILVGKTEGIQDGALGETFFKTYDDGMLIEDGKNDGHYDVGVETTWN